MQKGTLSASILATPLTASAISAFGGSIGKDFSAYSTPTPSKLALAHFKGSEVNGVVTVDFQTDGITGKTAEITISGNDSLSCDDRRALGKFALLKSVNLGCRSATLKGTSACGDLFGSEFGAFAKKGDSLCFENLPGADLKSITAYATSGYACAATAIASIAADNLSKAMSFGLSFGHPSFFTGQFSYGTSDSRPGI